jgi:outer membrane receptor for Fe3+-dicitrate
MPVRSLSRLILLIFPVASYAQSAEPRGEADALESLAPLVVSGKAESLIGLASSASKGQANAEELAERPYLRRGELLEVVPGVVITQHSGDGKANQYFVRGFNLDHGNDFSVFTDGQPINFVTHAHGQGYADLNPIIPELVGSLDYWKGPFFAELGDLSTAGAARFQFVDELPHGIATLGVGENHYLRGLLADTIDLSPAGNTTSRSGLTYALEYNYYDGPWLREGNGQRLNGFLRYFNTSGTDSFRVTAMGYDARWDSTDQIPLRAIRDGSLPRLGNLDDTVGGSSSRYSLMASWDRDAGRSRTHADVYLGTYDMQLFSNFTYFLEDPVRGDQFEQNDNRIFAGAEISREWDLGTRDLIKVGVQTRHDLMDGIGLYNTERTVRFNTVREDDVYQASAGVYATGLYHVNDWLRIQPGLRADAYHFDVDSMVDPANSGTENATLVSPKLSLIFGPWANTEVYLNAGTGFHSNDARGVTLAADPVDPLVRTYGYELGVRTEAIENVVTTVGLFYLHSDSELLYVGDAGTSEAGPASERFGIEWATYWRPNDWLSLDNELTLAEARLLGVGSDREIAGSVPLVLSTGMTIGKQEGLFATLRSRVFSARPLTEDGSVESRPNWQVNTRLGYRRDHWEVALDCLNLLGRNDNDIEYFYDSQLASEAAPVGDIHLHPSEPRTLRASVTLRF